LAVALTGAGLLRLGDRIPDPLLQAQCPPPQTASTADRTPPATKLRREFARNSEQQKILLGAPPTSQIEEGVPCLGGYVRA